MKRFCTALVAALGVVFGILSQLDLRLEHDAVPAPTVSSVIAFYDAVGTILMNDLYHHLFEEAAMDDMLSKCEVNAGDVILEVGPGSGFFAEKLLTSIESQAQTKRTRYIGVDLSKSMLQKSSQRLQKYVTDGTASMHLANSSLHFIDNLSIPIDKVIMTYVLDLMPPKDISILSSILSSKLSASGRVCVVNLSYGFTPLSRIVTNTWQLLYTALGGHVVGGCRPIDAVEYFSPSSGYSVEYQSSVVSAGLPSQVVIFSHNK